MSQRSDYFSLAAVVLVVAAAITGINSTFFAAAQVQNKPFSFWTSPGMAFAYALLVLAAALVWLGLGDQPFPPWKRIQFPNLDIDFQRMQTNTKDPGAVWLAFGLTITNHETTQPANLAIYYRGKIEKGGLRNIHPRGEDWGETPFVVPKGTPPDDFPTDWFGWTVNILPQHTASGYYVARVDRFWWDALAKPLDESLLILDRVSGQAVFVPAQIAKGPYNSSNWGIPTKDAGGFWTVYPADSSE